MIRINLLPAKDLKRRGRATKRTPGAGPGSGGNLGLVFILILALEVGGLYYWYMQVDEATQSMGSEQKNLEKELAELKKAQTNVGTIDQDEQEMKKQRVVFEELEHGKVGPLNMLLFLSYALSKVDISTMTQEEYAALTDLWAPPGDARKKSVAGSAEEAWEPQAVWLTSVKEVDGAMSIDGQARDHEDVMTFLRRLKTSIYFEGIDLVKQQYARDSLLKEPFVSFKLKCELNYDPRAYPPL